jgi:hypothetical protein
MLASPRPLILGMLCRALPYTYQTKEVILLIVMLPEFQDKRFVELLKKSDTHLFDCIGLFQNGSNTGVCNRLDNWLLLFLFALEIEGLDKYMGI